jgi:hypothetical protein
LDIHSNMNICITCIRVTADSDMLVEAVRRENVQAAVCHESAEGAVRHEESVAGAVCHESVAASSHEGMVVDTVTPMVALDGLPPQAWPPAPVYQSTTWHAPMPRLMMIQQGHGDWLRQPMALPGSPPPLAPGNVLDEEDEVPPPRRWRLTHLHSTCTLARTTGSRARSTIAREGRRQHLVELAQQMAQQAESHRGWMMRRERCCCACVRVFRTVADPVSGATCCHYLTNVKNYAGALFTIRVWLVQQKHVPTPREGRGSRVLHFMI